MAEEAYRQMTTRDYVRLLRRRKRTLGIVLAACVLAALLYNALATPAYEGRAELVVRSEAGMRPSILAAAAPLLSLLGEPSSLLGAGDLATQVQLINSRPCLEQAHALVNNRRALLHNVRHQGLKDEDLLVLPEILELLPNAPPPSLWSDQYQALLDTLLVSGIEDSQVIEVRCESTDRELAADFINALALAYLGRSLAEARAAARRTREYVQQELGDTEERLAEAEDRLRYFGEATGTVALETAAEQQIGLLARLDEQAAAAEAKMNAQAALQGELMAQLNTQEERVIAATVTTRNPEIVNLQNALAAAEAERVSLLEEYTADSPPARQATAKVDELRQRLAEAAEEVVGSREEILNPLAQEIIKQLGMARGEHLGAREALRVMRKAIGRVEAQLSEMPAEQLELLRLQREVKLLEKIYLALKEKEQEYEIAEKTKMPSSSLIEHAIPAEEPLRPKRALNLAAAIVAGILLGLLAVAAAEHLDESFGEPEEVARTLGLPVIAVLGGAAWRRYAEGDVPESGPMRETLEVILRHTRAGAESATRPTVALVAPVSEAGEARVVAEALVRVGAERGGAGLLIAGEQPGLAELAAGSAGLEEVAQPLGEEGLRVIGLGAEPLEGLSAEQIGRALEATGAEVIVVACPAGSGIAALGPLLRGGWPTLMVVALRRTPRSRAVRMAQLLAELGARVRSVIATGGARCEAEYYTAGTTATTVVSCE